MWISRLRNNFPYGIRLEFFMRSIFDKYSKKINESQNFYYFFYFHTIYFTILTLFKSLISLVSNKSNFTQKICHLQLFNSSFTFICGDKLVPLNNSYSQTKISLQKPLTHQNTSHISPHKVTYEVITQSKGPFTESTTLTFS